MRNDYNTKRISIDKEDIADGIAQVFHKPPFHLCGCGFGDQNHICYPSNGVKREAIRKVIRERVVVSTSKRYRLYSQDLQGEIGELIGYVSNGEVIEVMILEGYRYSRDVDTYCCSFNASWIPLA